MGGAQPIPMTDVLAYVELYGTDDVEVFVTMITAADLAFLEHLRKTQQETDGRRNAAKG